MSRRVARGPLSAGVATLMVLFVACPATSAGHASQGPIGPRQDRPSSRTSLGGISWPAGQALPTFAQVRRLDVVPLEDAPGDVRLLFGTLEGLVNRQRPRIYLIGDPRTRRAIFWLRRLRVPSAMHEDPWEVFGEFAAEVKGMIVYDPAIPDTINLATTLAGLRDAVVASPRLANKLADRYGLPVLDDLRGRFTDAMAAYTWQFENLWPETTHRMLVAVPPLVDGGPAPAGRLRDYAVANRAMVFFLDPTIATQRDLLARIMDDVEPNTPYLGFFPNDVEGESSGVQLASEHAVYVLAADDFVNMTVLSARCCHDIPPPQSAPVPHLRNKIYVTFTISDGDNLAFDENNLAPLWEDRSRGTVPINWTISPLLWDAAPVILRTYRRTATANDLLVSGGSGAGDASPTPWPDATFRLFTQQTATYMQRVGLDVLHVYNGLNDQQVLMSHAEAQAYIDDVAPLGIQASWWSGSGSEPVILNGSLPQSTAFHTASVVDAETLIDQVSAGWDGSAPRFISILIDGWTMSPSNIVEIASSLGPEYNVIRADQYFELIREASGLPARP